MKILKFAAEWCGPCKMLSKTIEGYNEIPIEEIDIDKNQEVAIKYNIRGVPTMLLLDDLGTELRRVSGMMLYNDFLKFVSGEDK